MIVGFMIEEILMDDGGWKM